jgi:hypothetical protein
MSHKYTTTFEFEINACQEIAGINVSKANIENLRSLIPNSVDLEKNIDLMGVAFNAAVVNEFNKNGDGIDTKTAIDSVQQFIHKPTNIEHNKKKVVGHIVNAGFSDYSDSTLLVNVDENETNPFNIALGAVVYKTVDKEFFDLLEKSTDPENKMHNTISASWEIGFSEYQIAVGSKNLKDAEIISDPQKVNEMKGMLRGFGGKGVTEDGKPIYRLITGKVYPLGIGFTMKPAANVKGVISNEYKKEENPKEDSDKAQAARLEKISDKISQNLKNTVNNTKIMDLETLLSEIKASLTEKKFSEEAIAGMTATFADAIKQKDDEYKASLEAAEQEKAEIASAREELQASVEAIKEELKAAQERIESFEAEKKAEEAVARFNARMEEIDSIYDLEESDSSFIAEKIKGLDDTEESFASFKDELAVFWASKNKEAKAKQEEAIAARVEAEIEKRLNTAEASEATEAKEEAVAEEVDVEEALENAEATEEALPNNNEAQASKTTLKEKFAAAFSRENILG